MRVARAARRVRPARLVRARRVAARRAAAAPVDRRAVVVVVERAAALAPAGRGEPADPRVAVVVPAAAVPADPVAQREPAFSARRRRWAGTRGTRSGATSNETLIKQIADTFVSSGMQAVGYQYVNLDDCWMDGRDSSGKLRWNTTKFPVGHPRARRLHPRQGAEDRDLRVAEHHDLRRPLRRHQPVGAVGSLGHETTDAQTFASWGIDYLKYDKCTAPLSGFASMRDALRATGRPIFYSINPGDGSGCPPNNCSINLPTIANMWRIGFDINGSWSSMIGLVDQDANLYSYAGPGHWNDPDMMEVGNGLTDTEGRTHFSMWAILAAPLIAGNDLRSMSAATKTTLTNTEVIAVDQDPLGVQGPAASRRRGRTCRSGRRRCRARTRARWRCSIAARRRASITVQWSALGIPTGARDGARPLEPHRSRNVQRLVHGVVGAEPRRRHAEGDQHALIRPWSRAPGAHLINSRTPALRAGAASRAGATGCSSTSLPRRCSSSRCSSRPPGRPFRSPWCRPSVASSTRPDRSWRNLHPRLENRSPPWPMSLLNNMIGMPSAAMLV